jgi:hypothetical protein
MIKASSRCFQLLLSDLASNGIGAGCRWNSQHNRDHGAWMRLGSQR